MKPVKNNLIFLPPDGLTPEQWRKEINAKTGMEDGYWACHRQLGLAELATGNTNTRWIDEALLRAYLGTIPHGKQLAFDIEGPACVFDMPNEQSYWNPHNKDGTKLNQLAMENRARVHYFTHRVRPDLKLGHFNAMPVCVPELGVASPELVDYIRQQYADDSGEPLKHVPDFYQIHCYPWTTWSWHRTRLHLTRAAAIVRDYFPPKPLEAVLFAGAWVNTYTEMPAGYWMALLQMAYHLCDQVCLYEGGRSDTPWNEKAEWWQATLRFFESLKEPRVAQVRFVNGSYRPPRIVENPED